ncbi:MAG TPA: AAA family ATPase [Candidatus Limnocylindrales bacterium]|jgi:DNA-binding NarL/FixJ family response regulator
MALAPSVTHGTKSKLIARTLVGRQLELEAIESAVDDALEQLVAISLEGEPGIGKTTLLNASADIIAAHGMASIRVVADEEIRGPLLLARAIFDNDALLAHMSAPAADAITRARNALRGEEDAGMSTLPADERLLRTFDIASVALLAIVRERPTALLFDDLQWADRDSIRLLRYIVRANSAAPMFLMMATRPEETAEVSEMVNLLADMERLGILRRIHVERLRQTETTAMLRSILGGEPTPQAAGTIHAQAEGVPFIIQELVRTYREAGLLQPIGGTWGLARNADRLVPRAVRTLIQRRAAALPPETREMLATGAVLGRAFGVDDLCTLRERADGANACDAAQAFERLKPALAAGLITEAGAEGNKHLTFSHEQVRSFALDALSPSQRQSLHAAIVEMLTADGQPSPEVLPTVVRHALAAGDSDLIARYSLDAARAALNANAPDEALRIVDDALGIVSHPAQRVQLLCIRDDALLALGRTSERLEAITELTALVEATGDKVAEYDVQLRRAAALRDDKRFDAAADVARKIRDRAAAEGDRQTELAACLELGQDLVGAPIGEGYTPTALEADLDGAQAAYERARDVATELGSDEELAQSLRELGAIDLARVRAWFVETVRRGEHLPIVARIAAGESLGDVLNELPISEKARTAEQQLTSALNLFERTGDRRGAMSAIVSLAYLNWGPELHIGTNPARRFEGIRELSVAMATLVQGSGREAAEGQMLYGAHVFARAKEIPDLAIERGQQAYQRARSLGDSSLEFLSAIGLSHVHVSLGEIDEAQRWLDRAADRAATVPTPHKARQVATASALIAGERGDGQAMVTGLREVARMASGQRRPAAQAEALALLAIEASRSGAAENDEALLDAAVSAGREARRLAAQAPGQPPWVAQADAAEARVALARGDNETALAHAREALGWLQQSHRDDPHLEILLPAARAVLAFGTDDEKEFITGLLQVYLALGVARVMDEDVRMRWFRSANGRELVELTGSADLPSPAKMQTAKKLEEFDERESQLLRLLVQGRTNREIGEELELDDSGVSGMLTSLYARIGTSSRAEATAFAIRSV